MNQDRKVAVITGASQGIGAALVEAYLEKGYNVVATSRSIEPSNRPDVLTVAGDIGDPETATRIVAAATERFGRIDTLINNAGVFLTGRFTQYSDEQYAQVLSTNINGFFYISRAVLEVMEAQGSGHIVSITTTLTEHALSKVPAALAALSKGGISSASRSLAIEFAAKGIRVNVVSPGVIKTPMHAPETHGLLAELHPMGRMGEISEIVNGVLYLESANFVTGEILHIDGGQSAGH